MTFVSTTVLALSMSADAFAVAVGKGAAQTKPRIVTALKTGAVFGIVESITPIIGWLAGYAASGFITAIDHWIAFTILSLIGCRMIYECFKKDDGSEKNKAESKSPLALILTAVGTSIDAMAVGVSLAFVDANIWVISLAIGFATFVMVTLGIMTGQYLGAKIGKRAEGLGGLGLICIGAFILFEHLAG